MPNNIAPLIKHSEGERGEEEEEEKEETSEETGGEERRVYDPQVVASIVIRWGPLVG